MKTGTTEHPKFKHLKALLGKPEYVVVGVLESIWMKTAQFKDHGGIGQWTDEQIAQAVEWDGDAAALIRSLVDSKWIDQDRVYRLVIHDWTEECPHYVHERIRKREARKRTIPSRNVPDNTGKSDPIKPNHTKPKEEWCEAAGAVAPPPSDEELADTYPVFPCIAAKGSNRRSWRLEDAQVAEWRDVYLGVDVLAQCRKAHAWIKANSGRRKTCGGMLRFLVRWLGKAQDDAIAPRTNGRAKPRATPAGEFATKKDRYCAG